MALNLISMFEKIGKSWRDRQSRKLMEQTSEAQAGLQQAREERKLTVPSHKGLTIRFPEDAKPEIRERLTRQIVLSLQLIGALGPRGEIQPDTLISISNDGMILNLLCFQHPHVDLERRLITTRARVLAHQMGIKLDISEMNMENGQNSGRLIYAEASSIIPGTQSAVYNIEVCMPRNCVPPAHAVAENIIAGVRNQFDSVWLSHLLCQLCSASGSVAMRLSSENMLGLMERLNRLSPGEREAVNYRFREVWEENSSQLPPEFLQNILDFPDMMGTGGVKVKAVDHIPAGHPYMALVRPAV